MVRTLLIIAAAGFVLMLAAFGGAAALGGPELLRNGWNLDLGEHDGSSVEWSGPVTERSLDWSGTDTLAITLPADVVFTQGDETSVVVRGPEGAVQRVSLVDGRLAFDSDDEHERITILGRNEALTVTITAPDVSRFIMEGFGDLTLNGIDRDALDISVQGAGDIKAFGQAAALNLVIEGAGDADLSGLTVQDADIRIEGAGEAEINASQSADIVINGVGDVDLLQRPANITQQVNGVGSVDMPRQ